MDAIEQAEELRQKAITILTTAREEIDVQLAQLGHGIGKKRGRKAKKDPAEQGQDAAALPLR